jgi:hypothetical protein
MPPRDKKQIEEKITVKDAAQAEHIKDKEWEKNVEAAIRATPNYDQKSPAAMAKRKRIEEFNTWHAKHQQWKNAAMAAQAEEQAIPSYKAGNNLGYFSQAQQSRLHDSARTGRRQAATRGQPLPKLQK